MMRCGAVGRRVRWQQRGMASSVRVAPLPTREWLGDKVPTVAVLIDIQRATSTLTTAFANGLREAEILASVEDARAAAKTRKGEPLLGGERNFVKIEGFDLDNSPAAYSNSVVSDRSLLFTSTNGAKALAALDSKATVALGSFLNQAAVRLFCARHSDVLLLCSGTHGERSDEDELFAGALASYLAEQNGFELADAVTRDVADVADHAAAFPGAWTRIMRHSANARGLIANGLAADIDFVSQIDLFPRVLPLRPGGRAAFVASSSWGAE